MKRLLILLFIAVLALSGCVQTKKDVEGSKDSKGKGSTTIELLGMSASEEDMNIVRDQLVKNGFDVKLNIQPDYGSFSAQKA